MNDDQRDSETREADGMAVVLKVLGGLMLAGTLYIWYAICNMALVSGLGMIGGFITAGIFKLVYPGGLDPQNRTQRYILLAFVVVAVFLLGNRSTSDVALTFVPGTVSAFYLFGIIKRLSYSKP